MASLGLRNATKLRDIISAKDPFFGARFDAVTDDTAELNTAFAFGANNNVAIFLPAGKTVVSDTLWVTPEGSTFKSAHVVGAGFGYWNGGYQTYIDASALTDRPAMNIQKARGVYVGQFLLEGSAKEIEVDFTPADMQYDAAWVTAGYRDSRYSPHCGIAIDAGIQATPPDGGYPNITYQGSTGGSQYVVIDCAIRRFVVGIMISPDPSSQADTILIHNPWIKNTKVAIAVGGTQANCITVQAGTLTQCRTCVDCQEYGSQTAVAPLLMHTQYTSCFEVFSHSAAAGNLNIIGGRTESVHRLGQSGIGALVVGYPCNIFGLELMLLNFDVYGKRCPLVYEGPSSALNWYGGSIVQEGVFGDSLNIVAEQATFDGTMFTIANRFRPYIGGSGDLVKGAVLRNCIVADATNRVRYGDETRNVSNSGRFSAHWSPVPHRSSRELYEFRPGGDNTYINLGTMSNIAFTDTTLTFDNTDAAGGYMVGDLIMWRIDPIGKSLLQHIVPAAKVTNVAAPTVTCDLLYDRDYYDETFAPAQTRIVVHEWAPAQALTGDVAASTTLANVSPTTILQNGDWVRGRGIPNNTRVASGGGTATVTLSRTTTATETGISIGWGYLINLSVAGRIGTDVGNASKSLLAGVDHPVQRWSTTLSANRTVNLPSIGSTHGDAFTIIRTADGAFTLTVGSTGLVLAQNQWCEVRYEAIAGAWVVVGHGNLHDADRQAVGADVGDAAKTLIVGQSERTQVWNTAITADRAVTLSATNAYNGARFRIVRTAAATGAFNLNVGTGPLKALAAGEWCDVEYDGTNWFLAAFGSL